MPNINRGFAIAIADFLDSTKELNELTSLSRDSIALAQSLPALTEMVLKFAPPDASRGLDLDVARRTAEKARSEVDSGYRHLFQQATISLWTAYEIAIDGFVLEWVEEAGSAAFHDSDQATKWYIRIPIAEAMSWWDQRERRDFAREVVAEIKRQIGLVSGSSPDRLERLLNEVGLTFSLERDKRRAIRELWAFRNLFVHRGHIADEQFVEQYPGDEFTVGEQVAVDNDRYLRFHHAVIDHVASIGDEAERVMKINEG